MIRPILILALACCAFTSSHTVHSTATTAVAQKAPFVGAFDLRKYGAKGDGKALDSPAINKAIDAAAAARRRSSATSASCTADTSPSSPPGSTTSRLTT